MRRGCSVDMDGMLVFVPQWYPGNPYASVSILRGKLKEAGAIIASVDLNIEFYNYILTSEFMEQSLEKARREYSRLACIASMTEAENNKFEYLSRILNDSRYTDRVLERLAESVRTFKEKDKFYDPEKLMAAKVIVNDALAVISAAYYPGVISFSNYYHPSQRGDFDAIEMASEDEETNIFLDFYNKSGVIDRFYLIRPAPILISVADYTQLLSAVTLYKLIKRRFDVPVMLGGNIITKLSERMCRHPEIFGRWCDYLCFGDGEISVVGQIRFLRGKCDASEVPGLAVLKNGTVKVTPYTLCSDLSSQGLPCLDETDFRAYYSAEPVVSLQLSKGCYWGKCAFCDVSYSRSAYSIKSPENAVREIEYLRDTYGISNYLICDDSVSPAYHARFSKLLIEHKCNISFFSMARLENGFTSELLAQMYRAGCRMIFWGYEAESPRVMAKINKGIDCSQRRDILRRAHEAGIWNHVSFMVGFPEETRAEALSTVDAIFNNLDIIDSCYLTKFSFKANARISIAPEKYGISRFSSVGEFLLDNRYDGDGLTFNEKKAISEEFRKRYLSVRGDRIWPLMFTDFEHHLLYLSKYGAEYVRNYRLRFSEGVSRAEIEQLYLTL